MVCPRRVVRIVPAHHLDFVLMSSLQGRMASTLHQRVERAIEEGELQPTTSPATVIQFILGQFAALSAVSRTNPTRSDLDAVVGYILAGLPWTEAR